MKKIICTILLALFVIPNAFPMPALALDATDTVSPMSIIGLSSDLTFVSGNTYRAWASAQAALDEDIVVGFSLYRKDGSSYTLVTSSSASTYGLFVKASKLVALSPGAYRLDAYYYGGSQSDSSSTYYTIK